MAQVSRPFQIALAAVVLFAVVWFVALQGHGSSSGSTPVATTPARTAAAQAKAAAAPTKVYHGAVPGLEGLTRDINRAHGAATTSQREAQEAESASAEAPSHGTGVTASSTTVVTKHGAAGTSATVLTKHVVHTPVPHKVAAHGIPARQAAVERELKRGEVAVVLFWNKKGADDVAVREELQILLAAHHEIRALGHEKQVHKLLKIVGLELEKKIAVHYASASQVASFGSFTRTVQVYGTPTILIINRHGAVTTLSGLTDAFAIEQTIDEARQKQS
jgi:hypothetical protein